MIMPSVFTMKRRDFPLCSLHSLSLMSWSHWVQVTASPAFLPLGDKTLARVVKNFSEFVLLTLSLNFSHLLLLLSLKIYLLIKECYAF